MIDYGVPIRAFYKSLLHWGFKLEIERGALVVTKPPDLECVPPVLADEIEKRATWLVKWVELDSLLGRPLGPIDADRLRELEDELGYELTWKRIPLVGDIPDDEPPKDPDWHDPAVQESIDRSYPSWMSA